MIRMNPIVKSGRTVVALAMVMVMVLSVAACSGGSDGAKYKALLINPVISGDTFAVPTAKVQDSKNTRFFANFQGVQESFMVYVYKGQTYARASVCVPCGARSFTLQGDNLVCDACGTLFDAATGRGKSGVEICQTYNKAPVAFQETGGNVVMKTADMLKAFQTTLDRKPY